MYDMKAYYESQSVADAVRLRQEHPEAHIIAGGSDVLVQMREGKRAGVELISIFMLDELRGISIDEEENIRIGSLNQCLFIACNHRNFWYDTSAGLLGCRGSNFLPTIYLFIIIIFYFNNTSICQIRNKYRSTQFCIFL